MENQIRRPIGQILLDGKFLSSRDLDQAIEEQKHTRELLGQVLVRMGVLKAQDIHAPLRVQEHLSSIDDAVKIAAGKRQMLGSLLVQSGQITGRQLDRAITEQKRTGEKLGQVFSRLGMLTERQLDALLEFQHYQGEATTSSPLRLGELLFASGYISRDKLEGALHKQSLSHKKIGEVLVEEGYVSPSHIKKGFRLQKMLVRSVLVAILSLSMGATSFATSVNLQWDANTETDLAGYKVYHSADSAPLAGTTPLDVSKQTITTISGLDPDKSYSFAVTAYNASGVESSFSNIVSITEQSPPTVAITSPADAVSVSGTVLISVTASDNVGVTKVEFYVNGVLKATDTGAPHAYSWDTSSVASGTYTLMAKAYDAAGNVSQSSSSVNVVKDLVAPTVALTSPANNTTVSGIVTISSSASDNVGVTNVEFYGNGVLLYASNVAPYSFNWDTTRVQNGAYSIIAKAYDNASNSSQSSSVTVLVSNAVDLTAPTVGTFTLPATSASLTVPVSGFAATDAVGVTGYMITESATAPAASATGWSATVPANFTFATAGVKTAYAWAKDAAGNVSKSASTSTVITTASIIAGETSVLANDDSSNGNALIAQSTVLEQPAVIQSLSFYVTTAAGNLRMGVYDATGADGGPGQLVASAAEITPATGWNVANVTTPVLLSPGTYWIAYLPSSDNLHFRYTTSGAAKYYSYPYNTLPSTFSASATTGAYHWSFYATFSAPTSDITVPVVSAFTMPTISVSLTVPVTGLAAADNLGVSGYLITESSTVPAASATGWSASAPTSFIFATAGAKTAYAWAKDAAGNVSAARTAAVTITLPDVAAPTVGTFTLPVTATALTVPVSGLAATDAVGVTGYLITESATAPAATATGWSATAPTSFSFSGEGSKTAYAWAKDAAGNVSASKAATTTITLPDIAAPTIGTFSLPATSTSLTVPVSGLAATDNFGVTGYLITESATAPAATATGWSATAPTSFSFSTEGSKTAYAWAKDAAGNVSASKAATTTITLPDVAAPTVGTFTLPATATSLTVPVSGLAATDNFGVTGYLITESATAPAATATGWSAAAPTSFTFSGEGNKTAYAWAKDTAGNVSASKAATTTITLPDIAAPTIGAFTLPATSTSLTVPVSGLAATDNIGVTGYLITESATAPAASATGWSAAAPASFTFSGEGNKTAYAWAKDAAGNVSASKAATTTITLPDIAAPTIGAFTLPTTSTSLTVPVSGLAATDSFGVTGYLITESATAPAATATGWSATAPTSFTFSTEGSKTAYAWAKDAAGNVSAARTATVTITLPDVAAPTVGTFTLPATATALTVPVSGLAATDNFGVTGYLITESATTPAATASGWSTTAPANFTFSGEGSKTAYAWAKDAAGNVSAARTAAVTITLPVVTPSPTADVTPPTITFSSPSSNYVTGSSISITASATDDVAVTKMELYVDGNLKLTTGTSSLKTKLSITKGVHEIVVKAYDAANNVATSSKTVRRLF